MPPLIASSCFVLLSIGTPPIPALARSCEPVLTAISGAVARQDETPADLDGIERLVDEGELAQAYTLAEEELKAAPRDARLLRLTGRLAFAVGKYERGEAIFQKLATIAAEPAEVYLELARLEAGVTRRNQAAEAAGWAAGANPNLAGSRAVYARHQIFLKLFDEAAETLRRWVEEGRPTAEEKGVYGLALLRLGRAGEALPFLRLWAEDAGATTADRCAVGEALISLGRLREAADSLSDLLADEPRWSPAYYQLGTALARLGQRDAARVVFERYRRLVPLDESWAESRDVDSWGMRVLACLKRAKVYVDSDQYSKALLETRKATKLEPTNGHLQRTAAVQLIELEALGEARDVLQKAVDAELQPLALNIATLGELERRSGHLDHARELLDRALAIAPNNLGALIGRGQVAFEGDEGAGRAREYFQRALQVAAGRWQPLYWAGRCLLEQGNARRALNLLDGARRASRGSAPGANAWLIVALTRSGKLDRAAELAAQVRTVDPVSVDLLSAELELARARSESDRLEQLEEALARARAVDEAQRRLRALPGPFRSRAAALVDLARSYQQAGMSDSSRRCLFLAVAATPEDPAIHRLLATSIDPGDPFMRAHELLTILDLVPDDVQARISLATLFAGMHVSLEKAERLAREAVEADGSAAGHHALGEVLLARGDRQGAAREARLATELQPGEASHEDLLRRAEAEDEQAGG